MRKLLLFAVSLAIAISLTISTPLTTTAVTAAPVDCDTVHQVCRDMSAMIYNICILSGGNQSDCAWQEALNTLNCLKNNGCGSIPKTGDQ